MALAQQREILAKVMSAVQTRLQNWDLARHVGAAPHGCPLIAATVENFKAERVWFAAQP